MNLLMQFSEYCLLLIKYGISIKVVWPEMFSLSPVLLQTLPL